MNKQKTILLVDDNEDIREAIQLLLEDDGYEVKAVGKGEYLEKLDNKNLPHLILLDLLLANTNGGELGKKLKNQDITKHIPIILMSAYPTAEAIAKENGIEDFIAKPFDNENLLKIIKKHL